MGGGPDKEVLLFIFQIDEPTTILNSLRHDFPNIEVLYHKLSKPKPGKTMGGIPYSFDDITPEIWSRVTILVTLGSLPPDAKTAPNLRYVHLLSAGVDHFLNHWIFKESDIPVTTVSGVHGPALAEWVVMTSLILTKQYRIMYENQKRKKWDSGAARLMKRGDWNGKVVGICGYGSIGRQVARVFRAMGAEIHAYTSSTRSSPEARRDTGYVMPDTGDPDGELPKGWYSGSGHGDKDGKKGLHTFLASGLDMLVMSVPLTDATRGMIGKEEFEVLYRSSLEKAKRSQFTSPEDKEKDGLPEGDGSIFVNLSRGGVVKTDALVTSLKDGKLQGAALDVTDPEPLPEDSELWEMENVVITPHVAALGREYLVRSFDVLKENLRRREKGQKLVNEVNRKKGYRSAL